MRCRIAVASLLTLAVTLLAGSPITHADEGPLGAPRLPSPDSVGSPGAVRLEPVPVEQVAREGDRTLLQVNNQTPFIVFVYVGGVRIGWIRPYRTAIIRGLANGYHTLYAHSQYGTMSWGPRDAWIPGNWNLIY
jgi:hypothetical protein